MYGLSNMGILETENFVRVENVEGELLIRIYLFFGNDVVFQRYAILIGRGRGERVVHGPPYT